MNELVQGKRSTAESEQQASNEAKLIQCQLTNVDEGFVLFHRPSVNLVHVQRTELEFLDAVTEFAGEFNLDVDDIPVDDVENVLSVHLAAQNFSSQYPEKATQWIEDMSLISRAHAAYQHKNTANLTLITLSSDYIKNSPHWMFLKPHIDNISSNCIVGYHKYGPDYYPNDSVNRSYALIERYHPQLLKSGAKPIHTDTGDILLIKGDPPDVKKSIGVAHHTPDPDHPTRSYSKRVAFMTY